MCGYVTFYKYISENVLTYCCATFTKIMNLFLLSVSPRRAVRLYGQRHVIKMVLEACQLMNNVYHIHECSIKPCTYRPTHMRHPWSIWASRRKRNFIILGAFAIAMCVEFRRRRGKPHKCEQQIISMIETPPVYNKALRPKYAVTTRMGKVGKVRVPLCMPETFHTKHAVQAYRKYYVHKMTELAHRDGWKKDYPLGRSHFVGVALLSRYNPT